MWRAQPPCVASAARRMWRMHYAVCGECITPYVANALRRMWLVQLAVCNECSHPSVVSAIHCHIFVSLAKQVPWVLCLTGSVCCPFPCYTDVFVCYAGLCWALEAAVDREVDGSRVPATEMHAAMRRLYTWPNVALRTETVYTTVMATKPAGATFRGRVNRSGSPL